MPGPDMLGVVESVAKRRGDHVDVGMLWSREYSKGAMDSGDGSGAKPSLELAS